MTEIVERYEPAGLTFNQRWNTYLALVMAVGVWVVGITLRNGALSATAQYEDLEAGVRAQLPAGWLLNTEDPDVVFRAEDPDALPFKTTLEVSAITVGPDATPNTVLDILNLARAPRFSTYRELSRTATTLRDDPAMRMTYAYTQDERDPFQASVPLVVQGVDVVVLRRGQAVIITYREERTAFDSNLYRFEDLLQTVEIF